MLLVLELAAPFLDIRSAVNAFLAAKLAAVVRPAALRTWPDLDARPYGGSIWHLCLNGNAKRRFRSLAAAAAALHVALPGFRLYLRSQGLAVRAPLVVLDAAKALRSLEDITRLKTCRACFATKTTLVVADDDVELECHACAARSTIPRPPWLRPGYPWRKLNTLPADFGVQWHEDPSPAAALRRMRESRFERRRLNTLAAALACP